MEFPLHITMGATDYYPIDLTDSSGSRVASVANMDDAYRIVRCVNMLSGVNDLDAFEKVLTGLNTLATGECETPVMTFVTNVIASYRNSLESLDLKVGYYKVKVSRSNPSWEIGRWTGTRWWITGWGFSLETVEIIGESINLED